MGYDVLSSAESWLEITSLNILDNRGKYPQYQFSCFPISDLHENGKKACVSSHVSFIFVLKSSYAVHYFIIFQVYQS